jgi:hypothetical protein
LIWSWSSWVPDGDRRIFRKGKKLGTKDHLIILTKPKRRPSWMDETQYNEAQESRQVRELKVDSKILATTLAYPPTKNNQ